MAAADFAKSLEKAQVGTSFDFLVKSDDYQALPPAWTYFFAPSIMLLGNQTGPEYVVGYYNPFLDAAIITQWRIGKDDRAEIARATLRSGAELETGVLAKEAAAPRWLASEKPVPEALADQVRRFSETFNRLFPPNRSTFGAEYSSVSDATLEMVAVHGARALMTLGVTQQAGDKTLADSIRSLRKGLAGDAAALEQVVPKDNPLPVAMLAQFSRPLRAAMVPVYAYWCDKDLYVFLADTRAPRFVGLAHYRIGGPIELLLFGMFDLTPSPKSATSEANLPGGVR